MTRKETLIHVGNKVIIELETELYATKLKLVDARKHLMMILKSQCLNAGGLRQVAKFGLKVSK
jgi:hypothetical protein